MVAGRLTLLDQSALADLLPAARERGTAVVAAGVFNSGLLSRPRPADDAKFDYEPVPPDVLARAHAIADVCERHGCTLPAARWRTRCGFPRWRASCSACAAGSRSSRTPPCMPSGVPEGVWAELTDLALLPTTA